MFWAPLLSSSNRDLKANPPATVTGCTPAAEKRCMTEMDAEIVELPNETNQLVRAGQSQGSLRHHFQFAVTAKTYQRARERDTLDLDGKGIGKQISMDAGSDMLRQNPSLCPRRSESNSNVTTVGLGNLESGSEEFDWLRESNGEMVKLNWLRADATVCPCRPKRSASESAES